MRSSWLFRPGGRVLLHLPNQAAADAPDGPDETANVVVRTEGFDLARRTVAKYREAMGIGSSVQRRRQKVLGG